MEEFKRVLKDDVLKSGYIPQKKKHTDYLYTAISEPKELPERYFANQSEPLVQTLGYCWAYTVLQILNIQDDRDEKKKFSLEYEIRKTKEVSDNYQSEGETSENAFGTVVKYGAMLEEDLHFLNEFPPQKTTDEMDIKAKENIHSNYIKGYWSHEIKQMIVEHECVGFGTIVSDSFYNNLRQPTCGNEYVVFSLFGKALGGHLFIAKGFDDTKEFISPSDGKIHRGAFLIKNTWEDWGDKNQEAWITYDAIDTMSDLGMRFFVEALTFVPKIENPTGVNTRKVQFKVGELEYTINGFKAMSDVASFISDGRTMVPVRFISEAFGYNVGWDNDTRTVTIDDGNIFVKLTIGSDTIEVDGEECIIDEPAQIFNNRTYVPIRFISENLGLEVEWQGVDNIVTVIK